LDYFMNKLSNILLTPAQQRALDNLLHGLSIGDILVLKGADGSGKTSVLSKLQQAAGGELLGMRQFMHELELRQAAAIEEAFLSMITEALHRNRIVIVDDLHLVMNIVESCDYQRSHLLDAALTAVFGEAMAQGRKLVFAVEDRPPWPLKRRSFSWEIESFGPEDYESIGRTLLPNAAANLDFARIHRFAPELSAQQLSNTCHWLSAQENLGTDRFIGYLQSQYMTSNVDLAEVRQVTWDELKGVDEVLRELEAKIALPFENDELRQELKLKPKRGVLLAGPPGTGKTTIGRALAHRLKSKFFLIDGTIVAGTRDFYSKVNEVFSEAKKNAPAIIFIDDADVIFERGDEQGFCRYLLTMLDGLESASSERVCVMLTAMHAGNLPQAMLRSGRVELWLDIRLPDERAREAILSARVAGLPPSIGAVDVQRLAAATHGLTGADLKNIVEDAILMFAQDRIAGATLAAEDYFLKAIGGIRANRRKYASGHPVRLADTVEFGFHAVGPAIY
jgi:transitional endoplasmic reticulum ATPase